MPVKELENNGGNTPREYKITHAAGMIKDWKL
jgi:hypothetical protein